MYKQVCLLNDYYCAKNHFQMTMTPEIYDIMARMLLDRIGDSNFFNGSIEAEYQGRTYSLRVTLIVYRTGDCDPADAAPAGGAISDIVPVWWEYRSVCGDDSEECCFSWNEFRDYISQYRICLANTKYVKIV